MTSDPADPPTQPTAPPEGPDPAPVELTPAVVYHPDAIDTPPATPSEDDPLSDLTAGSPDRPAPVRPAEPPSGRWRLWLVVGVLLQALAAGLWYFYITGHD